MSFKFVCAVSALAVVAASAALPAAAGTQFFGPSPYLSAADSPFVPANYGHFYLEDFEDGLLNTPGLGATGAGQFCVSNEPGCFQGSGLIDSVGNGGDPNVGHSLFDSQGKITLTFDATALGALPTAAGLVWTDGLNPIVFEAFDQNGVSLGTLVGNSADNSFAGGTSEDRFYGVTNTGGISKLIISDESGIEIDHVQYGVAARGGVPEPAAWALMLIGFVGAGGALRARRRSLRLA
ncbi:MAG: PEPxxWA-CTERM sorting domain-containing protein [Phenylobacterium sp.]